MKLYYDHDHIYKILILLIQNVSFLSLLSLSLSPSLALLSHPSVLFYILSSLLSPSLSLLLSLSRLSSPLLSFLLSPSLSLSLSLSLFSFARAMVQGYYPLHRTLVRPRQLRRTRRFMQATAYGCPKRKIQ